VGVTFPSSKGPIVNTFCIKILINFYKLLKFDGNRERIRKIPKERGESEDPQVDFCGRKRRSWKDDHLKQSVHSSCVDEKECY